MSVSRKDFNAIAKITLTLIEINSSRLADSRMAYILRRMMIEIAIIILAILWVVS